MRSPRIFARRRQKGFLFQGVLNRFVLLEFGYFQWTQSLEIVFTSEKFDGVYVFKLILLQCLTVDTFYLSPIDYSIDI